MGSTWSAFWSRFGAVNIRVKVIGIVAACILASALALLWYDSRDDAANFREHLTKRGISIGQSVAAQSRDLILTDNQFALYKLAKDTRSSDQDIVYVFVLNADGNVLVHTFEDGFPNDLLGINQPQSGDLYRVQVLRDAKETILDVAVPVLGGKAGVIRLGMSEASIKLAFAEHLRELLFLVALILVLALLLAYGLSSILTTPIARLSEAARAIGRGDFRWKAPIWAKDEIGILGIAFNDMSEELKRKEKVREQLLAKLIRVQEDERKRIARELHDETGQALTSLMVGLKAIEHTSGDAQISKKTAELRSLAAQTLNEVHRLATELRPTLLDDLGLDVAIQRYCAEYSAKMNINVDTHISGASGQRLPPEIEVTVYRIIQEGLTNISRHAKATNVSVVLRYQDSSLMAIIEDDGVGFDVGSTMSSANGRKLGLFGMYERASLIGGNVTIESQPGSGTTIFLEVPMKLSGGELHETDKNSSG